MCQAILTIDCKKIVENYNLIASLTSPSKTSAVVKANAYGLGASIIAKILERDGCQEFFVANLSEGISLRQSGLKASIYVLHGLSLKEAAEFLAYDLVPVLNNPEQIRDWSDFAAKQLRKLPAIIHIDTGIARLGLNLRQALALHIKNGLPPHINLLYVMSHLASADQFGHFHNYRQLKLFQGVRKILPNVQMSLSNSAGVFLGSDYHFDLVRPGMALYGLNPTTNTKNPMQIVVRLETKIIQITVIDRKTRVGYGSSYVSKPGDVLATIGIGYADGYMRSLSNAGHCYISGYKIPIVGRISMDLTIIDVSKLPTELLFIGQCVELIGENMTIDQLAAHAGTIGYEMLTNLGNRFERIYITE